MDLCVLVRNDQLGYQQLEDITNKVEWQLRDEGHTEVSSRDIGEHVMNLLMHVDQVSYVGFASVYKEFKDVDQLLASMQGILSETNGVMLKWDDILRIRLKTKGSIQSYATL